MNFFDFIMNLDAYGFLIIDDLKIKLPLYKTEDAKKWQKIVDDADSAIIIPCTENGFVIVDHAYQGFDKIKKCNVGTFARVETNDFINYYKCTEIDYDGINIGTNVLCHNQKDSIFENNYNAITLYTCNDFNGSVTVVKFEKVSVFDKTVNICSL